MDTTLEPEPLRPASETVEPEAQPTTTIPFEFTGKVDEYFKIWIVNVALTICTLGIYSAWAKVRKKRYLYGNTWLQGTSFEYLGDPTKILKGRLIIGGGLLIYFLTSYYLPIVEGFSWLLFLLILPWLVVTARTFIARNSAYCNIRFDFRATWGEAFKVFFGLALIGATGLGYPYFACRRSAFLVSNSRFGTTPFALTWDRPIGKFYGFYLMAAFAGFVSSIVVLLLIVGILFVASTVFNIGSVGSVESGPLGSLVVGLVVFAYLKAEVTNFIWSNATLGKHRFGSYLDLNGMIWLYVSNALAIVLSLGLLIPWVTIRTVRYRLYNFILLAAGDLDKFVASQQKEVPAAGEEAGEFFDVDVGI